MTRYKKIYTCMNFGSLVLVNLIHIEKLTKEFCFEDFGLVRLVFFFCFHLKLSKNIYLKWIGNIT